jgi:hypothetical protein
MPGIDHLMILKVLVWTSSMGSMENGLGRVLEKCPGLYGAFAGDTLNRLLSGPLVPRNQWSQFLKFK